MPAVPSLIAAIANDTETARFLAWRGDFELERAEHVEEVHLASGAALEGFAGDGTGGTFFFCGEGGEDRPVLYANSEGGAALVAIGVRSLLQLLLVAPWWRDFREFTSRRTRSSLPNIWRKCPTCSHNSGVLPAHWASTCHRQPRCWHDCGRPRPAPARSST